LPGQARGLTAILLAFVPQMFYTRTVLLTLRPVAKSSSLNLVFF
jgi:hypothetical protein